MEKRSSTKIPCYKQNEIIDTNGTATIVTDGETFYIEIKSDNGKYETVIDISDILTELSKLV